MEKRKNAEIIKKDIEKMIHTEKNKGKIEMLHSAFNNNIGFAKEREQLLRLGNIIDAMKVIDRKFFVPISEKNIYADSPLPISHGQTISQPTTVARMLLLSRLEKGMDVLEIGAGSGWNASLASKLVSPAHVTAVERIAPLAKFAEKNFEGFLKCSKMKLNAKFVFADALNERGEIWRKKYDRIIVTAGASNELIKKLHGMAIKLLKDNGLLIYPTQELGGYTGALELWKNKKGKLIRVLREEGYAFVPLREGEEK